MSRDIGEAKDFQKPQRRLKPGVWFVTMSTKFQGSKRSYPSVGAKGDQKTKFAKTQSSANSKRGKPPPQSSQPILGKKTEKRPYINAKPRGSQVDEGKKRKRPITAGGGEVDENEEEEDEVMDANGNEEKMLDQADEKRPRMSKIERAALHAAQPHRTSLLPSHPLLQDKLLPLWETARRADLSKEARRKAVAELWESVKGRVGEVSRGHKGGRVLQTVRETSPYY